MSISIVFGEIEILLMGDAWRNNRGHWELSIGIYLDLQKALDPVDHSQLIRKLERCWIRWLFLAEKLL